MAQERQKIEKLLASSAYRSLPEVERAMKLVNDEGLSQNKASMYSRVERTKLRRAIKAQKAGRPVGQVGRPRILNDNMEELLKDKINDALNNGETITSARFRDLVRYWQLLFRRIRPIKNNNYNNNKAVEMCGRIPRKKLGFWYPSFSRAYMHEFAQRHSFKLASIRSVNPVNIIISLHFFT